MKTLKILMILCSIFMMSLSFADDDYDDYESHKNGYSHIFRSLDYLNLNKLQYQQIRKILIEYKNNNRISYEYKLKKQKELEKIMQEDVFHEEKYIKISSDIKTYFIKLQADKLKKIHKVLTPKQRIEFSYFLGEWEVE